MLQRHFFTGHIMLTLWCKWWLSSSRGVKLTKSYHKPEENTSKFGLVALAGAPLKTDEIGAARDQEGMALGNMRGNNRPTPTVRIEPHLRQCANCILWDGVWWEGPRIFNIYGRILHDTAWYLRSQVRSRAGRSSAYYRWRSHLFFQGHLSMPKGLQPSKGPCNEISSGLPQENGLI